MMALLLRGGEVVERLLPVKGGSILDWVPRVLVHPATGREDYRGVFPKSEREGGSKECVLSWPLPLER